MVRSPISPRTVAILSNWERRRVILRCSLVLNFILLGLSLYITYGVGQDGRSFFSNTGDAPSAEHHHHQQEVLYWDDQKARLAEQKAQELASLKAESDSLRRSLEPCSICTAGPVGQRLCNEWGKDVMTRLVSYSGTNNRLRRTLAKMRAGEPFTMASIGGSVSAGHGLRNPGGNVYAPTNMHRKFFEHLNRVFPAADGVVLKEGRKGRNVNAFVNGAEPARGSDYFSQCSHLHLPEDVDFVVVELAINDQPHPHTAMTFELLLRSLLEYQNSPGVMLFNTFALMFDKIAMGGDMNHGSAQFYDVPTLSSRNAIFPLVSENKTKIIDWFNHELNKKIDPETFFGVDLRHFGTYMHGVSGDMMMAYIELQLCEMDRLEAKAGKDWKIDDLYPLEPLPKSMLMAKFNPQQEAPKLKPFCMATGSKESPLTPSAQSGWREWSWKDKDYIIADKPGSKITFDFTSTQGRVTLYYLRSKEFGLGNLACEIEGMPNSRKVLEGYWTQPYNIGQIESWFGLSVGDHKMHCELLEETSDPKGGKEFRLIALMSI